MSDCFNHEADAWDSLLNNCVGEEEPYVHSYLPHNYFTLYKRKKVKCKHCGKKKLHWVKLDTGWRLHTKKGKLHNCKRLGKLYN